MEGKEVVDKSVNLEYEDPYSHYYLHHSDNTASGAVTPLLNGTNYHTWHRAFLMSLSIRNKTGFIDGTLKIPDEKDPNHKAWIKCNTLIMSWLMHSVSMEIKSTILYCDTAQEAWQKLKTRYAEPNEVRVFQLEQELNAITQGTSSVTEYFTKLSCIWEELGNYQPVPSCTCGAPCKCKLSDKFEKMQEIRKVYKFLMNLNDSYELVRGSVILREPLPSLDKDRKSVV